MQTAFVLGGGGLLGAHEVGMLRALSRRACGPIWSWGPRSARSTAYSWRLTRPVRRTGWPSCGRARRCATRSARRSGAGRSGWCGPAPTCTPSSRSGACWTRCCPAGTSPISRCRSTAWRPASRRPAPAGSASGPIAPAVLASCAVPGLLPPVEVGGQHYFDGGLVDSIPVGRAVALGARTVFVLQVGRIERPLTVPRRPWQVGLVAFEIARRHRFHEEMSALPGRGARPCAADRRRSQAAGHGPAPLPRPG